MASAVRGAGGSRSARSSRSRKSPVACAIGTWPTPGRVLSAARGSRRASSSPVRSGATASASPQITCTGCGSVCTTALKSSSTSASAALMLLRSPSTSGHSHSLARSTSVGSKGRPKMRSTSRWPRSRSRAAGAFSTSGQPSEGSCPMVACLLKAVRCRMPAASTTTSEATRCGKSAASRSATAPPIEWPTTVSGPRLRRASRPSSTRASCFGDSLARGVDE